ncbi:hypothetical protein D3C85_782550 [compost metagenome]
MRFGQIGAQRAAHLHRAQRTPRGAAAAKAVEQVAQAQAERRFHQPAVLEVAGELERQCAVRAAHAVVAVVRRALGQDDGHGGQRDHVVDDGGLAEQARDGGQRRLGADHAALALQAFQQGRFFAADVGAGALAHFQVEAAAAAVDIVAQPAHAARSRDGGFQGGDGVRVFGAHVDVAVGRAHRQARDGHAFDQDVGVAFHQQAVGEGAGVAFVGVADDVFGVARRARHRLPFDAGGKRRAAAAAQAGFHHFVDDLAGLHGKRALQALQAAVRGVVLQGQRIDHADAGEGQAFLALQIGNVFGRAQVQRVGAARQPAGVEQRGHVFGLHRAVGDAALRRGDFDQGFEPEQAARAVAHHLHGQAALVGDAFDIARHRVRVHGQRRGVARYVDDDGGAHDEVSRVRVRRRSSLSGVTRAWGWPSIITAGDWAHRPRQYTGSSEKSPSFVLAWKSQPSAVRAWAARRSPPMDWQASARQTSSVWRAAGSLRKCG